MSNGVVSRPAEARAIASFLVSGTAEPSALVVQGEPGIGKTTLWAAGVARALEGGFRVLSARPAEAESVMAYASLADLLGGLDVAAWAELPDPQRLAVDRILLRTNADDLATDQRAVAAGFLSVIEHLSAESPVLVAIDDLQWLDLSSRQILAFAARRIRGRVALLATVRTDPDGGDRASWLQMPRPDGIQRIQVPPLSLGALHAVLSERLGRSFSRPTMVRIEEVSGGNPFYALELARALDGPATGTEAPFPGSLTELVRTRIGNLPQEVYDILLAASCVAAPTVELVASATGSDTRYVATLLADAESSGIIGVHGNRLRFGHPLLARGVYTDATPARRRGMHRRLAAIVTESELRARHLALAATSGDPQTLQSLDEASDMARLRGAPAAAAELLDLAIGLGGDDPARRIRLASHHTDAGEPGRARALLEKTIEQLTPGMLRAQALSLLAVVRLFDDSFVEAAELLEGALDEVGDNLALRIQMTVTLSFALFNAGQTAASLRSVEDAVRNAERLGVPDLLSQALGMQVMLRFLSGDGLDEPTLQRALELEDRQADIPLAFRPSVQNALLLAWAGQLEPAHREMQRIRRRCVEHGEESELIFVAFHVVMIEIWRGSFTEAALAAEDAMERALQLDGDVPLFVALTMRATLDAYAGREAEARHAAADALAASQRCGSSRMAEWPVTSLGFLEVSQGDHQAALTALEPLLSMFGATPDPSTEIIGATFVPDAVEALIQLGRLDEAEPLIDTLERNGRRLDRAWQLAVGARCRAMLLAARGELDAATATVEQAMTEHDRLPMPFERARTQLLLGQLQRRKRQKDTATATLSEALRAFERLDTPLWADKVRAELARTNVAPKQATALTPSEQRVAELAATGMTNRDVAAALFISPKTVEANLAHVYRKLHIHSRAELGRRMSQLNE
jgi:ATP/maltotriose-dependent transcriptional regulator MalT